ncbi:MAG: hypothetical protein AAB587_02305, partial [Patescibacteria group bacterium]
PIPIYSEPGSGKFMFDGTQNICDHVDNAPQGTFCASCRAQQYFAKASENRLAIFVKSYYDLMGDSSSVENVSSSLNFGRRVI